MQSIKLDQYLNLIESFINGRIQASEFERQYLKLFKNDSTIRQEKEFSVLDKLFSDVDAFCDDPLLRDENDIDEDELRQKASEALGLLTVLREN